ncbi:MULTISPECIES: hypothetical protein [Haloarcula]|uniref:hypothetical protein n=1 Tax=Haloarcula TaxID=2237 RepID=UPI0023ECA0CD|nr:hypothetical protein [Halomicroarcula sp. XH51]
MYLGVRVQTRGIDCPRVVGRRLSLRGEIITREEAVAPLEAFVVEYPCDSVVDRPGPPSRNRDLSM